MTTVVVTGGTGFIGSHTVEELLRQGYRVRSLIRPNRKGGGWLADSSVEITYTNFDRETLPMALEGADWIIHIAGVTRANRRKDFFQGNVDLTARLLSAAATIGTVKKFCFLSSLTAVGPSPDGEPVDETTPSNPITAYGASKLEAERLCHTMSDQLPVVIIRPPAVYGPRDRDILHMFRSIKLGILPVMGNSKKTLSMIYVTELARAITAATFSSHAVGKTYFVGDEERYEYAALADIAASLLGTKAIRLPIPTPAIYAVAALTQGISLLLSTPSVFNVDKVKDLIAPHWVCSSAKIAKDIGFQTRIKAAEGLQLTLEWYRRQGWL